MAICWAASLDTNAYHRCGHFLRLGFKESALRTCLYRVMVPFAFFLHVLWIALTLPLGRLRALVGFVLMFATNCKNNFEQSCRSPAGRFLNRDALVQPPFLIICQFSHLLQCLF